jgi:hypothetical protein
MIEASPSDKVSALLVIVGAQARKASEELRLLVAVPGPAVVSLIVAMFRARALFGYRSALWSTLSSA